MLIAAHHVSGSLGSTGSSAQAARARPARWSSACLQRGKQRVGWRPASVSRACRASGFTIGGRPRQPRRGRGPRRVRPTSPTEIGSCIVLLALRCRERGGAPGRGLLSRGGLRAATTWRAGAQDPAGRGVRPRRAALAGSRQSAQQGADDGLLEHAGRPSGPCSMVIGLPARPPRAAIAPARVTVAPPRRAPPSPWISRRATVSAFPAIQPDPRLGVGDPAQRARRRGSPRRTAGLGCRVRRPTRPRRDASRRRPQRRERVLVIGGVVLQRRGRRVDPVRAALGSASRDD